MTNHVAVPAEFDLAAVSIAGLFNEGGSEIAPHDEAARSVAREVAAGARNVLRFTMAPFLKTTQ